MNFLHGPAPDNITLNLNWEPFPSANSILKLLVSIPYHLRLSELYDSNVDEENRLYAIRSLIIFSNNHYYSYVLQTVS